MKVRFRYLMFGLCALGFLSSSGCTMVGGDYQRPEPRAGMMELWNGRLDGAVSDAELDPQILAEWWRTFNDETLNSLIERAIAANLDLRTAQAQLRRARAERNIADAGSSPSVALGGSARRDSSPAGSSELYSASLDASWEIDVFGGIARGVEAAEADLQAVKEARRDVLVSVLAEVAINYAELRTLEKKESIASKNLTALEDYLKIVKAKQRAGDVTQFEVDQASSNVDSTRSTLPALAQQVRQLKNRLAVLVGANPGAIDSMLSSKKALSVPSVEVAVGVPAEVLRRRPDVRKAERELAAQTARVGVAVAELYPKFSLQGSIGLESLSPGGLLTSIGPRAQWTIFDGGRIRQQIEIQDARQEEALVQYERAILTALEDVENAINAFSKEQLRYRSLASSARSAKNAAKLAESRFKAGDTDFLSVLDTQRSRLSAEDELAQSNGSIVTNLIRLYKALGGGWKPENPTDSAR